MGADLAYVRAWQRAARGRSVELAGVEGKAGAVLVEGRHAARYSSVTTAALALAAGYVRWRAPTKPKKPPAPRLAKRGTGKRVESRL